MALAQTGEWVSAFGTFTKGLDHDEFGRVRTDDLRALVSEINQDQPGSEASETPLPGTYASGRPAPFAVPKAPDGGRKWHPKDAATRNGEGPLAGHTFELSGPDPDDVAMPPASAIGSAELTAEIAKVYAMALLRDVPFKHWDDDAQMAVRSVLDALNRLDFYKSEEGLDERAKARRRARKLDAAGSGGSIKLDAASLFRGSTKGAQHGPYPSQFLLIGNAERMPAPMKSPKKDGPPAAESAQATQPDDALTRPNRIIPSIMRGTHGA